MDERTEITCRDSLRVVDPRIYFTRPDERKVRCLCGRWLTMSPSSPAVIPKHKVPVA